MASNCGKRLAQGLLNHAVKHHMPTGGGGGVPALLFLVPARHLSATAALAAKPTKPLEYHQLAAGLPNLPWERLRPGEAEREFPDAAPVTDKECQCILQIPKEEELQKAGVTDPSCTPLTLVFGWAGSTHRNVAKYSDLWRQAGCTTLQYVLPSRHIFRDTPQVPVIMDRLLASLDDLQLSKRPVFIHCLSDTGVICYQGLDLVLRARGASLDVRGVVWDSCPGPRPVITAPRVLAIMYINYLCELRNGLGPARAAYSSYRLLMDRGWPNYLRRLKGLEVTMNLMQGVWCGHFGRDHSPSIPELFLYSKKDFYIPWRYMEDEVLSIRRDQKGRDFKAVRFDDSPHVGHLRKHKDDYRTLINEFLTGHWSAEEEAEKKTERRAETTEFRPEVSSEVVGAARHRN